MKKNFLFFDIECSDGNHICSFGYVLTDANLNILDKRDILVNPEAKFVTGRSGFDPNIKFAYSKEEFLKAPVFEHVYEEIFGMLKRDNQILIGHSIENDFKFLINACRRYNLDMHNFRFFDTQLIYKLSNKGKKLGLGNIAQDLGVDCQQAMLHRSDDDALLTKEIFGKLCVVDDTTPQGLLDKYSYTQGCVVGHSVRVYESDLKSAYKSQIQHYQPIKDNTTSNTINPTYAVHSHIKDKSVYIAPSWLDTHLMDIWTVAELIIDNGGEIVYDLTEVDIFVWDGNSNCKSKQWLQDNNKRASIVEISQLCDMLCVQWGNLPTKTRQNYRVMYNPGTKRKPKPQPTQARPTLTTNLGDLLRAKGIKV
jgi:DNA polymerase III epsilon subunit-like protein